MTWAPPTAMVPTAVGMNKYELLAVYQHAFEVQSHPNFYMQAGIDESKPPTASSKTFETVGVWRCWGSVRAEFRERCIDENQLLQLHDPGRRLHVFIAPSTHIHQNPATFGKQSTITQSRKDNRLVNLAYGTPQQNSIERYQHAGTFTGKRSRVHKRQPRKHEGESTPCVLLSDAIRNIKDGVSITIPVSLAKVIVAILEK